MPDEDFDPDENDPTFDVPASDQSEKPPDVVSLAAKAMIQAALSPDIEAASRAKGAFTILISPSSEWSETLLAEWQTVVLERTKPGAIRNRWGRAKGLHVMIPDGDRPRYRRQDDDASMSEAVSGGHGALIVTHDMDLLTATERAAADVVVTIPKITGEQLVDIAAAVGTGDLPPIHADLPVTATPAAMRLSARPGNTAAEFIARLARFVASVDSAKPSAQKAVRQGLDGLHGMDEAVGWGRGLARDLKAYARGELAWESVAPGCLLAGPPGTGKTVFAHRLAAEADASLVVTSYSEWQSAGEAHLGTLIKCLRARFAEARKRAPSILFIDEIDSVQSRTGDTRHQDWWTSIINSLLSEFGNPLSLVGVVVIAATNHVEKVDPALLRAGRLDTVIRVKLPDAETLALILHEVLAEDLADEDLSPVAQRLLGGTGADCEKAVRGARRRARDAGRAITSADLLAEVGGAKTRRTASLRTAIHEAGHAVVVAATRPQDIVSLSVEQTNRYLGGMLTAGAEDAGSTPDAVAGVMRELLSGRAAEEVVFGCASGGSGGSANSDLARATLLAVSADLSWGLGKTLAWHGDLSADDAGRLVMMRADIAARVEARLAAAYSETLAFISKRRRAIEVLADALLAREVMSGDEVRDVLSSIAASAPKVRSAPAVRLELADDDAVTEGQYPTCA